MGFFFRDDKTGAESPIEVENVVGEQLAPGTVLAPAASKAEADAQMAQLREQLAASNRQLSEMAAAQEADRKRQAQERAASVKASSLAFAKGVVQANKLLPAGLDGLSEVHAYAQLSKAGLPTEGIDLAASVDKLVLGLNPHELTAEAVTEAAAERIGSKPLENGSKGKDGVPDEARQRELLKGHPSGAGAIRMLDAQTAR